MLYQFMRKLMKKFFSLFINNFRSIFIKIFYLIKKDNTLTRENFPPPWFSGLY